MINVLVGWMAAIAFAMAIVNGIVTITKWDQGDSNMAVTLNTVVWLIVAIFLCIVADFAQ